MKSLVLLAVVATLASFATTQEQTCPDDLRVAANRVFATCAPVLPCKGKHGKQQNNDQDAENENFAEKEQKCLEEIQSESAFAEIYEKCAENEKQILCMMREFKENCPDFAPPQPESEDS